MKDLIPCSDVTVAASIFPEAFGMVAIEALASGLIPVLTNHSGFSEIIHEYEQEFRDISDIIRFKPLILDEQLVLNIAHNIIVLLDYYDVINDEDRQEIRQRAKKIVLNNYSWRAVALKYLSLYSTAERQEI